MSFRFARGVKRSAPIVLDEDNDDDDDKPETHKDKTYVVSKYFAPKIVLSNEQQRILDTVVKDGASAFITGVAGSGKTLLTRHIIDALRTKYGGNEVYVTAMTGVAATHVGGTTFHLWLGCGLAKEPVSELVRYISRAAHQRLRSTVVLVVDEISMMHPDLLDKADAVCRIVRENSSQPFGGIQLVFVGDFYQLPPVRTASDVPAAYAFQAKVWKHAIDHHYYLRHVFRQKDDAFVAILNEVRDGNVSDASMAVLKRCIRDPDPTLACKPTVLYCHRNSTDKENAARYAALRGDEHVFDATDWFDAEHLGGRTGRELEAKKQGLVGALAPERLALKVGTQVLLTKNLNVDDGLCNGARGTVVGFAGTQNVPMVQFTNGITTSITHAAFDVTMGRKVIATRTQIPLAYGWAATVHKAQGMTLDAVVLSLREAFEQGQAYVALSRVTSLDGLYLKSIDRTKITSSEEVAEFYKRFSTTK